MESILRWVGNALLLRLTTQNNRESKI